MAEKKLSLEEMLKSTSGQRILFLGKEALFSDKEIQGFLKNYGLSLVREYSPDISAVIEHSMLNPVEEDISCMAYDAQIPLYDLGDFEKLLSKEIKDDELLMILKLSNDQDRLFRLLGNEHISNSLFVKLLLMHQWQDEDDDDRNDRDVISYTLRRYVRIKPNEEDLLYSYLTLRRLATKSSDVKLLFALLNFPNFTFLLRGKANTSLRETIAKNPHIDEEIVQKLLRFRQAHIDQALAGNTNVNVSVLELFAQRNIEALDKALATNTQINTKIFNQLLDKGDEVLSLLLYWQNLDLERFVQIEALALDSDILAIMGANENLSTKLIERLLKSANTALLAHLCANKSLLSTHLASLYAQNNHCLYAPLAGNPHTPIDILEALYTAHNEDEGILLALSKNPSTPIYILELLFAKEVFVLQEGLASNASLPKALLDILQVDTRLRNALSENEHFVSKVTITLDY